MNSHYKEEIVSGLSYLLLGKYGSQNPCVTIKNTPNSYMFHFLFEKKNQIRNNCWNFSTFNPWADKHIYPPLSPDNSGQTDLDRTWIEVVVCLGGIYTVYHQCKEHSRICIWSLLCWALVLVEFVHIFQGYFTGNDTIERVDINGLEQDCTICIANALEILQSCTKPSIWSSHFMRVPVPVNLNPEQSH